MLFCLAERELGHQTCFEDHSKKGCFKINLDGQLQLGLRKFSRAEQRRKGVIIKLWFQDVILGKIDIDNNCGWNGRNVLMEMTRKAINHIT